MIKRFCDVCKAEITSKNCCKSGKVVGSVSDRITGSHGSVMFEIITGCRGSWNTGDFCRFCVLEAIRLEVNNIQDA
jgi:hypothetical protein